MNRKPIVAIVGRPNVGKSTLFNRLVEKQISIIDNTPGVTRDRIYRDCEWLDKQFTLIDTGGIEFKTSDDMFKNMRLQTELAIETADVIMFLVDGKSGFVDGDSEVAKILRKSGKKIILVVNKIDSNKNQSNSYEFYKLGFKNLFTISSSQGLGIGDLLDEVISNLSFNGDIEEDDSIKIAIIGKPNVGKSSLINKILGENRTIVSDVPGTTRDSIDSSFSNNIGNFTLIDTAGLRKKSRITEDVERYSMVKTMYSIDRADVCLLIVDAKEGVTEQDERILGYAFEKNKAIAIIVNKWDLIEKDNYTHDKFKKDLQIKFKFISYAPYLFISALTGQRVSNILLLVKECFDNYSKRIKTGILNEIIGKAISLKEPPIVSGRRLKIYYCTQVDIRPPKFLIFVNDKNLIHFSYGRYIENQIRSSFDFNGTGINIEYRERKDES